MKLDSVRGLKQSLQATVIKRLSESDVTRAALGVAAQALSVTGPQPPTIAVGVSIKGEDDYALAVRIQKRGLENSKEVEAIRKEAKGEVDVRYVGRIQKFATPQQKKNRPLKIGVSAGHVKITAGTLGAFVRDPKTGATMILSNNHVLANENKAKAGDAIIQPGHFDGGTDPADRIATLTRFIKLKRTAPNLVDAAVATLLSGIEFDPKTLAGLGGKLAGVSPDAFLDEGTAVGKVGRTTGTTKGRVTAFELDNVGVTYGVGLLFFNDQIEIEGADDGPFSQGGDSGSLIVDASRKAVGLLFAGGDTGGSNGKGLTYANPIHTVLSQLKVELMF